LTLNPEISEVSQKWVDHLASTNSFGHNPNRTFKGGNMGENCAMNYRSDGAEFTGEQAVQQWYSEIERYDFSKNEGPKTGHFTQCVWKGSKEFGVARAKTSDGKWLVVANFYPPGNYAGKYGENVFPTK
jgi:uncharacterized protein YkwD